MVLGVSEQMVSQRRSTTFSKVAKTLFRKPRFRISFQICSIGFISGVYGGIWKSTIFSGTSSVPDLCHAAPWKPVACETSLSSIPSARSSSAFNFDVPLAGETALTAKAGVCTDESLIRKVSRPNPDYVLHQPGAVLNWCDVTAKEGYFCLNDRFWDLTKAPGGVLWLGKLLVQVVKKLCGPKKNTSSASGLFVFHKDITILQYFALLDQIKVHFDKEELLRINDQLNKIKKPRH